MSDIVILYVITVMAWFTVGIGVGLILYGALVADGWGERAAIALTGIPVTVLGVAAASIALHTRIELEER